MPKKIPSQVKLVQESYIKQSKKNKHISYSQLQNFATCPKKWQLTYVRKIVAFTPSIHMTFGTAMHETIQSWLDTIYNGKIKDANAMDLDALLYENMIKAYKSGRAQNGHQNFTTPDELRQFWLDGKHILKFLKSKRGGYFSTKNTYLAGIETLLYQELKPGVFFKGFIDLVFYNETIDRWTIVDIKTSTKGWSAEQKKDTKTQSQLLLYKEFFSKQFNIPIEKIDVEYFIVKRRVPVEADFAAMQRRVQEFRPASGPRKIKGAIALMDNFVNKALDSNGNYVTEDLEPTPSKDNCRFCEVKNMRICSVAVL